MSQCFKIKLTKTFVEPGGLGKSEMEAEQKVPIDRYSLKRFDIQKEDVIDANILETIPFDYPGSATEVTYETDEFTSVCPWTGLPDFARLIIRYVPDRYVVELKSLKYYLTSYRNVGILQEHAVNRMLSDLVQLLQPVSMSVEAYFRERGGLKTQAIAKYEKDKGVIPQSR
jgi:7-cyano-7-deazaguanine reductase